MKPMRGGKAQRCGGRIPSPVVGGGKGEEVAGEHGFTLLEVLIASTILSLILAILYGVFSQTLESKRLAEERIARSRVARGILLRLSEELQASFPLPGGKAGFIGEVRDEQTMRSSFLSFVSFVPAPLTTNGREGDLCQVSYLMASDSERMESRHLVRRINCDPNDLGTNEAQQKSGEIFPLASEIHGIRFRFFNGREWLNEWGSEGTRATLPRAVEAVLYFTPISQTGHETTDKNERDVYSTIIDLPMGEGLSNSRGRET